MAGGHRLADLKDGYTIGQIKLFLQAANRLRRQQALEQAESVALGIAEALNPKAGLLAKLWQALKTDARPAPVLPPAVTKFFGGAPVISKE